jgi:hypothetical protein
MSQATEEMVLVRDRQELKQLAVDEWTMMTLFGSLSDDPRSFDELARAWLRYRPDEPLEEKSWNAAAGEQPEGPWVLLDLACRRIVAGGSELPESPAAFQRDEGEWHRDMPVVWINLPPAWRCLENLEWSEVLPPLPTPAEPLDVRGILFGRALAQAIARQSLEIARGEGLPAERACRDELRGEEPTQSQRDAAAKWYELTLRVHKDWLMTPREDLEGEMPRSFLHRGRDWVDRELGNRERQWSNEGRPPRPLDRDTFAYRYGPLGRNEVVMYFDLCREVIGFAWDQLSERPEIGEDELAAALHQYAQWWLAEGEIDGEPTPPAEIIDSERRRLPLAGHGPHFDDCPICRMQAEDGFGPMFMSFDGYHLELDEEFAFSLCETREEWEEEQEDSRRMQESIDLRMDQVQPADDDAPDSVWKTSYVNEESIRAAGSPPALTMMGLAMRVSELVTDLKSAAPERVEVLNDAFDAYRAADGDPTLSDAARRRLVDLLEEMVAAVPEMTSKAADFQSQLDQRQRDSDVPF